MPSTPTRAGVFVYRNPDGTERRELRPPEEVGRADSLASLKDAPVIEGHPDMIRTDNWAEHTKGHVSGDPKFDGELVSTYLVIQAPTTLAKLDSGELEEISCGYSCREDHTPGEWHGQRYDLIQRDIVYNHVGLGPRGWGRAGHEARVRLDGAYCVVDSVGESPSVQGGTPRKQNMKIRFDGKEYESGSEDHVLAMCKKLDELEVACEESDKAKKALVSEKDVEVAKKDEAEAKVKDLQSKLDVASDPKRLDALCAERVALIVNATKVLGEDFKADGKTNREVMALAITKAHADVKLDGKSDEYVQARFDALVESGVRADSIDAVPGILAAVGSKINKSEEQARKDAEEHKKKLDERDAPIWDAVKE